MEDTNEEMDFSSFNMDTSNKLFCIECFSSPNELFIADLRIVCADCQDSSTDTIHNRVRIQNQNYCLIHDYSIAKWQCKKLPHLYCDICHLNNCLASEKSTFVCEPSPLFFTHNSEICFHCKKIIAEFTLSGSNSPVCHRCAEFFFATSSVKKINENWISNTKEKYVQVLLQYKELNRMNTLVLAKFEFYMQEIQALLKNKYSIQNRSMVTESREDAILQFAVAKEKNQKAEKILIFLNKENTFNSLIQNSGLEFESFTQFLDKILEFKVECSLDLKMKVFTLTSETMEVVCSQENPESYDYNRMDESEFAIALPTEFTSENDSISYQIKEITEDPITTTCIYYKDPFYMFHLKPGCENIRRDFFILLKNIQNPRKLRNSEIELGMEILFIDTDRTVKDENKFKRGRIERLPSSNSNTCCVFAVDFGYKLPLRIQNFFELPREFWTDIHPSNLFMTRLMGIAKFKFKRH